MFGLFSTPRVAGHTILVTLYLFSPTGRPVQITTDLESFWKNTYMEMKKDLMGRYPKDYWSDYPLEASLTYLVKPNKPVS